MRNWGTVVTGFYIAIVAALSPAVGLLVLTDAHPSFDASRSSDWLGVAIWGGWTLLIAGGPLVLLFVGVGTSRMKPRPRRHILISAAATGLALSLLIFGAVASVVVVIVGDQPSEFIFWSVLAAWPASWLFWTLALWRMGERLLDPATPVYRWLTKGSVLELLIVVPSHVIVRGRHDCCAPGITGMGIATGLSILLMSLGPGALFLYRGRMRRLAR
ncbi:MAG TPA: hypothetical protein VJN67_00915 [Stellaceae bacterium]|nr:hypothetical protein [Stellaceae bacterium]